MEAEKKSIRSNLRKLRRLLPQEEVDCLSNVVCSHARDLLYFQRASSVGLYLSIDNEVDPTSLLRAATLSKKTIFLPVVDKEQGSMRFALYREGDPLTIGAFGIPEPVIKAGINNLDKTGCSNVSAIDVLFLPLVAFDPFGRRLGYGGGYYDRVLAPQKSSGTGIKEKKTLRIGLAYSFQKVPVLPEAAHDIPMDFIITEQGCLAVTP